MIMDDTTIQYLRLGFLVFVYLFFGAIFWCSAIGMPHKTKPSDNFEFRKWFKNSVMFTILLWLLWFSGIIAEEYSSALHVYTMLYIGVLIIFAQHTVNKEVVAQLKTKQKAN